MFADIKIPLTAIAWVLLVSLVIGTFVWGVLVYRIWREFRCNDKKLREQMIHIERLFKDDGK